MEINSSGKLEIDINWLLDGLTDTHKIELIERLSCEDAVIKHVADQLIDGYTDGFYSGSTSMALNSSCQLDIQRDRIAKMSYKVARNRIDRLERMLSSALSLQDAGWCEYHKLMNSLRGK